jgi:Ni,Fe-hydrogenase III large subunit/Ni,Fe-hydrogenase III component G
MDIALLCTILNEAERANGSPITPRIRFLPSEIVAILLPAALPLVLQQVQQRFHATFADLFGVETEEGLQLHVLCALDTEQNWLHLQVQLNQQMPDFPSLVAHFPVADWYERQVWQEVGIQPQGHPLLRGLRLPPDWPENLYPHRMAFRQMQSVPSAEPKYGELVKASPGVVDYPLGPVRSGVVESGHYMLRTVGEELIDMHLQLFYKHRGVEHCAVGMPLTLLPLLAERVSGTSAFAHSLALCQAIEQAAEVELPPRANYLRTLLAELERLYNHLGYQADLCQATGLVVAQAQFDMLKERLLRLNAQLSGHRYLFGMNIPGGLSHDVSEEKLAAVRQLVDSCRRDVEVLRRMVLDSPSHQDRLEGSGILRPEDARAYGAVGPIGRASGVDRDLRRDHPYAAYAEVSFDVPLQEHGDAQARATVRMEETLQTLHILEQMLERLQPGRVAIPLDSTALPAGTSALGWVESPRGESLHWLLVGEHGAVERYRVRPASFANWQAFPLAIPGHNILTDFPVIEQSFGLSFAGADC